MFSIMILHVVAKNNSTDIDQPLAQHPLHKGWICQSVIGILGFILNSLIIKILYLERGSRQSQQPENVNFEPIKRGLKSDIFD